MVQIQKAEKKVVYRYLLQQGVIVIHKDFTENKHKGTGIQNIKVWMMLRSLKDRGFVEIVFNWQYFYYFLNAEGKKYLSQFLGLTEDVVPLTWKKDEKRRYQVDERQGRTGPRPPRTDQPSGSFTGGRGAKRPAPTTKVEYKQTPQQEKTELPPLEEVPKQ